MPLFVYGVVLEHPTYSFIVLTSSVLIWHEENNRKYSKTMNEVCPNCYCLNLFLV